MSKQDKKNNHKYATQEAFETLEHTAQSSEHFLEKNAKIIAIVFGAVLIAAIGYFAYLKYIVEPKNQDAQKEIVTANNMFAQDSMQLALNGSPGAYMGYNQIIDEYSGTEVANLANYKAGIASYKLGEYQKALDYFNNFKTDEVALKAINEGAKGDALVQLGKNKEAFTAYKDAIKKSDLQAIQRIYTKKAAILAFQEGMPKEGLTLVNDYLEIYNDDLQGNEMEKLQALLSNTAQK